jgi:hypothetical protein
LARSLPFSSALAWWDDPTALPARMVCLFSIANRWTDQLETEKARTVVASRHPQFLSKPPTALGRLYLTADLTLGRGGGRPQARATLGKCYMRDSLLRFNKQFSLWTFFSRPPSHGHA